MIDCQAEGIPPPTHQWKKAASSSSSSNDWISIVSGPHVHVLENGSLVIIDADKSDEGEYVCGASSTIASISSPAVLVKVRTPAHFKKKFVSLKTRIGDKVSLVCDAYGDEPIKITWSKGNEILSNSFAQGNKKFIVQENVNRSPASTTTVTAAGFRTSTLLMETTSLSDSGFYACSAANSFGREEMSFQLLVQSVPDPPAGVKVIEVTGRRIIIGWKESPDGNSPIIEYALNYKKNDGNAMNSLI